MFRSFAFYLATGVAFLALMIGGVLGVQFGGDIKRAGTSIMASLRAGDTSPNAEGPYPPAIRTTFLTFDTSVIPVPQARKGAGGGLTRFGDGLVLMTHDGRVFGLGADRTLNPLDVALPDNGFDAFVRVTSRPEYADQIHLPPRYRYNGFQFVDAPVFRGFLMSTTYFDEERICYTNRLYRASVDPGAASFEALSLAADDWELIYETSPCLALLTGDRSLVGEMASGRMVFDPPHTLYMTNGDYYLNESNKASGLPEDMSYGKIAAIDLRDLSWRYFSEGHRNPSGIARDRDGNIWSVEHGAFGGDELNLIEEGNDYGWPEWSFGQRYDGTPLAPPLAEPGHHDGATAPVYAWLPSAAVSSITTIDGFDPTWDGDLIVGTLGREVTKGRKLYRIRIVDQSVVFAEEIRVGERIRDVIQWDDQTLVLWMDRSELVLLTKRDVAAEADRRLTAALNVLPEPDRDRVAGALGACRECHSIVRGVAGAAPSLYGVVDRPIAATRYPAYSDALRTTPGTWTSARLAAYIKDPESVAAGTTMMAPGITNDAVIGGLIQVLDALDAEPNG